MKNLTNINYDNFFEKPIPPHYFTDNYQVRKQSEVPPTKIQAQKLHNSQLNGSVKEHLKLYEGLNSLNIRLNRYDYRYSYSQTIATVSPLVLGTLLAFFAPGTGNFNTKFKIFALPVYGSSMAISFLYGNLSEVKLKEKDPVIISFGILQTILNDQGVYNIGY